MSLVLPCALIFIITKSLTGPEVINPDMCFIAYSINLLTFNMMRCMKFAGGLIQLNHGQPQSLQYAANAAFMASLFADYMLEIDVPGWQCGSTYFPISALKAFATSQVPSPFNSIFMHFTLLC